MKIGIDARSLSRQLTGMGIYTLEMCKALSKIEGVELCLYAPEAIKDSIVKEIGKPTIRNIISGNAIFRQIWSETYLPYWAKKDQVDIFWGPSHRLPLFISRSSVNVVTIHDLVWKYAGETMRTLSRMLEKIQMPLALKRADGIMADSTATATALFSVFPQTKGRVSVVHLASRSDEKLINPDIINKYNIKNPYFIFVGTLEPRKNLKRLIEAYSNIKNKNNTLMDLVIVGGAGWGDVDIDSLIKANKLSDNVKVVGYADESTLATLYDGAKFLAMPSIYEGFGLPIVEAMSYGTPVLTSNNSSMPEVAGDAAVLIDAQSVKSIEAGINELMFDEDKLKLLSSRAKKQANKFSWDISAQKMIDFCDNYLKIKQGI
jgi:glycosyltransferase involved in cell wall biosynthesis